MTEKQKAAAKAEPAKEVRTEEKKEAAQPVAFVLTIYAGGVQVPFTYLSKSAKEVPSQIQDFIRAFQEGNPNVMWRPSPQALTQFRPAQCTGYLVRSAKVTRKAAEAKQAVETAEAQPVAEGEKA